MPALCQPSGLTMDTKDIVNLLPKAGRRRPSLQASSWRPILWPPRSD